MSNSILLFKEKAVREPRDEIPQPRELSDALNESRHSTVRYLKFSPKDSTSYSFRKLGIAAVPYEYHMLMSGELQFDMHARCVRIIGKLDSKKVFFTLHCSLRCLLY